MFDSYTVTALSTYIRELFEVDFRLQDVWVEGEISNLRQAPSGHWYFTLKDSQAQLKCVMWRSSAEQQTVVPRDGDAVLAHGRVSVYEAQGAYQLYADQIRPVGAGNLYQQFEQLKAKLLAEGLFDEERKRPIPTFPRRIGVVTSAGAAAFQDIQNVLRRRFPLAEVILSPTLVQGADAPPQIVAAIERLNQYTDVDVILVCRGGGSIEDLWAFNDEGVARAVAASKIPTISGVGHEIDFTIVDFVADLRAPTPSAAAELATPNLDDLRLGVRDLESYLVSVVNDSLASLGSDLTTCQRELAHISPANTIRRQRQRIDDWQIRLGNQQKALVTLWQERLASRTAALHAASPQSILSRGYAIVYRSEDNTRISAAKGVKPGVGITIQFHDDELKARVEDKDSHERYKRTLF
ncbi:MAG: exodeoxyribonuclease VII large subunit [Anaerolineaceae bacterium]|nr:exodeoxyribonuclease VII large subunit [Anaerolineaceae bacterium]